MCACRRAWLCEHQLCFPTTEQHCWGNFKRLNYFTGKTVIHEKQAVQEDFIGSYFWAGRKKAWGGKRSLLVSSSKNQLWQLYFEAFPISTHWPSHGIFLLQYNECSHSQPILIASPRYALISFWLKKLFFLLLVLLITWTHYQFNLPKILFSSCSLFSSKMLNASLNAASHHLSYLSPTVLLCWASAQVQYCSPPQKHLFTQIVAPLCSLQHYSHEQ